MNSPHSSLRTHHSSFITCAYNSESNSLAVFWAILCVSGRAAQASALLEGRTFVVPDGVKQLAVSVLSHRVVARGHLFDGQRQSVEAIIQRLVDKAPMPE